MVYDVWCMVYGVWCMVYGVCCMLYAVCYMLYTVCCILYAVYCMLYAVCCTLSAINTNIIIHHHYRPFLPVFSDLLPADTQNGHTVTQTLTNTETDTVNSRVVWVLGGMGGMGDG